MPTIKNKIDLDNKLFAINQEISNLNDKKIIRFLEAIGLNDRADIPQDYLKWETILIVVPSRQIANELKHYKYSIDRISFATNNSAKEIHIYNLQEWKNAFRNKTQLQIRNLLKTSFGGVKKTPENYLKTQSPQSDLSPDQ